MFQFPRSAAAHMRLAPTAALQSLQPTLTTPTGSPLPHYAENEVHALRIASRTPICPTDNLSYMHICPTATSSLLFQDDMIPNL